MGKTIGIAGRSVFSEPAVTPDMRSTQTSNADRALTWFHDSLIPLCVWAAITLILASCGGGGGSGSAPSQSPVPPVSDGGGQSPPPSSPGGDGTPPPDDSGNPGDEDPPADDEDELGPLTGIDAASRLASRASFGSDWNTIQQINQMGEEAWIESQFTLPLSSHDSVVDELVTLEQAGAFDELIERNNINNFQGLYGRAAWWQTTVNAEDQLRQRVAYALSQIFVISDSVNALFLSTYATSNYYDMLLRNAFGNYRDLLLDVTLHPSMGLYLSHLNNAKGDPDAGTFPDENYAREVMQLFSIGLFELNRDGSERVDDTGRPIASYDNQDIGEFAKIFTGLGFGGDNNRFGSRRANFQEPMRMFNEFHESAEKSLLNGVLVPAGQDGLTDIEAAVDNLFNHPNTPPFIGRRLIQRLVSSNPSPDYISRVSDAFIDNGDGVRGDMRSVLRAILLDPEARATPSEARNFGKLREPLLRYTAMLRQLNVQSPDGFYANVGNIVQDRIQQHPLSAPSVFNFYLPDHTPIGEIAEAGLVAPEFQITNSNSVVEISNLMQLAVIGDFVNDIQEPPFAVATLTLSDFLPLAGDIDALLDRLDTVFTYGTLSVQTRDSIRTLLTLIEDDELRVRIAAYLVLISPDYAVEM
ncbi:MAG: DUF1800 family protein [Pseudomonadota bacterium]